MSHGKQKKSNKDLYNEGLGIISGLSSLASAVAGARAGYASAKGGKDAQEAIDLLKDELKTAFYSFERSLQKMGYSGTQIQNMREAFSDNIDRLLNWAIGSMRNTP